MSFLRFHPLRALLLSLLCALIGTGRAVAQCQIATQPSKIPFVLNAGGGTTGLTAPRSLPLVAGDAGRQQAIRVTAVQLPAPFNMWDGTEMWVSGVRTVCGLSGEKDPPCAAGTITWQVASLSCNFASADFRDWTLVGEIYIQDELIVPSVQPLLGGAVARYDVHVLDSSCPVADSLSYSAAETFNQPIWADSVGQFVNGPRIWPAPDGTTNILFDIPAMVQMISNAVDNPGKMRMDLVGSGPNCELDNVVDILFDFTVGVIGGFHSKAYPFAPGVNCPNDPCSGG